MIGGPGARTRNALEMRFFVSLEPCRSCGQLLEPERFDYGGDVGTSAVLSGKCDHCLTPAGYSFLGDRLSRAPGGTWDEVAPGRTEVLAPSRLAREFERLGREVVDEPARLEPADWEVNRELNKRALQCGNELVKLLDDGRAEIADDLLDAHEREQRAAHPSWYQRAWLEPRLARHRAIVQATIADLPRMNQLNAAAARLRPKGIDSLDREAMLAHEQWVERKQQGKGRLVLVRAKHRRCNVGRGAQLSGARFHEVDLPNVSLEDVKLVGAELNRVRMTEGRLYAAILRQAVIVRSSLKAADLSLAEFDGARISDTDLSRTNLDLTRWAGAVVESSRFDGAVFSNASLDGVTFRGCSFRGAGFAPAGPTPAPTTRGARFEDCDLRDARFAGRDLSGATFVRCRFAGSTGSPVATDGLAIEAANLAVRDDEALAASPAEVLAALRDPPPAETR